MKIGRGRPESAMHKLTQKMSDQIGLIWLSMVGYIVYVEFFKDVA